MYVQSRNTRRKCDMFKVNNNGSRAMMSFCSGAIECYDAGLQQIFTYSKSTI